MQHSLISPSTAGIHINVAGMVKDIEILAGRNRSLGSISIIRKSIVLRLWDHDGITYAV
jgi:hypothetical protein